MFSEKQSIVIQTIPEDAAEEAELSFRFTKEEHALSWWEAMRMHYPAIGWGLFMNLVSQIWSVRATKRLLLADISRQLF